MDDKELTEDDSNPDFYFENGLMVFTANYLLKRGYCCNNGCRHCPYGFSTKVKQADDDAKLPNDL